MIALDRLACGQLAGVLPIRLAFAGDYLAPVRESLAAIQAAVWNGPDDTRWRSRRSSIRSHR